LKKLPHINCVDNRITDITPIKDLKKLTKIYFSQNKITDISPIKYLKKLNQIDFSGNQITDIAPIKYLKNLTKIEFTYNKITDIAPIKDLKQLKSLDLRKNPIKKLEEWICDFPHMNIQWKDTYYRPNFINFYDTPIKTPPIEIIKQGKEAIKDWFERQKVENNEIKLILTGNTTAGKTSLIQFLLYGSYPPENSTHGISIYNHKIDNLNVNIWDFGGQEYYHATHKLFLSNNAVYLLLWEKQKNRTGFMDTEIKIEGKTETEIQNQQHFHYNYWLHLIRKKYAKDSPILMVQNKIGEEKNHKVEKLDTTYFDDKTETFAISVEKAHDYLENKSKKLKKYYHLYEIFKQNLLETIEATAHSIPIQKYFANIRTEVRKRAKKQNILKFEEYRQLCIESAGEEINDDNIRFATKYLHETGVLIYYGYEEQLPQSILKDYVFVNPQYVCDSIYKILNLQVKQNLGQFDRQHVENILQDAQQADLFIALMQSPNFELIYKSKQKPYSYIASQYLPEEYPEGERSYARLVKNKQTA